MFNVSFNSHQHHLLSLRKGSLYYVYISQYTAPGIQTTAILQIHFQLQFIHFVSLFPFLFVQMVKNQGKYETRLQDFSVNAVDTACHVSFSKPCLRSYFYFLLQMTGTKKGILLHRECHQPYQEAEQCSLLIVNLQYISVNTTI